MLFFLFLFFNLFVWMDSGIVATVFGATGFLGRYLVSELGEYMFPSPCRFE